MQDSGGNAANLLLNGLTQTGPQIDTTTPSVASVVASGTGITAGAGDLATGKVVTLTLNLSEAVTVAGGTPTLTLNDGGTATYVSGTGTNALTFSYTVGAGQNTADLAVTAVNLGTATVKDGAGNAADLTGAVTNPAGTLQIDTTTPVITSIAEAPTSGDLNAGKTVTYTLTMSEAVTVNTAGGSPTLTLNDGGTATYVSGTGTNALTFSYTVLAGQNTPDLMVSAVNLNGATLRDGAGNAASLSLVGLPQGSPQVDTIAPTVGQVVASPGSGIELPGNTVTLTLTMNEVGDGHRHPDADAQRWRHRDLCQRHRHQYADLQLHGWIGRQRGRGTCDHAGQPAERRNDNGWRRQRGQLVGRFEDLLRLGRQQIDQRGPGRQ